MSIQSSNDPYSREMTTANLKGSAKTRRLRRGLSHLLFAIAGIFLFLLIWHLLATLPRFVNVLPKPLDAVMHFAGSFFAENRWLANQRVEHADYYTNIIITVRNILVGAAFGTVFGLAAGLGSLVRPIIAEIFTPVASFFGTAPIFIAAPFFVIWFGTEIPLLTTIGLVTFYTTLLMYFFSRRAAENLPAGFIESALTLGGDAKTIFRWVYLPGTVPEIAGGFRIALAGAWGLGALVEVLGLQQGGGFLIYFWVGAVGTLQAPAGMVSIIVFFGVLAVIADALLVLAIRAMTRWAETGRRLGL
jgi:ABC-type nitrate/sulfonate/bicarbonate transport system permease component